MTANSKRQLNQPMIVGDLSCLWVLRKMAGKFLFPKKPDTEEDTTLWQFAPALEADREPGDLTPFNHGDLEISNSPNDSQLTEPAVTEHQTPALPFSTKQLGPFKRFVFLTENRVLDTKGAIEKAFYKERELGSLFNFLPVFLALGIGAYFSVLNEPNTIAILAAIVFSLILAFKIESRGFVYSTCILISLFFIGMLVALWQTNRANTSVPRSEITAELTGLVLAIDQNQSGSPRYLIRPVKIEGMEPNELPPTIRLSASKKHRAFVIGDSVAGLARLSPISGPAYPGGYDFSFPRWMEGLGLSGFFMGAPELSPKSVSQTFGETLSIRLQAFRQTISLRIRAGLPGEAGDIATALITGDRSGLSQETQESLRRSGLAHILAISGLHMALVTLTVIWIIRMILVVVPGLAENYPIKKWAIGAGFVTATGYMFLSGASIATQRAWLMITVMLVASLMDRRAITMRSVTMAAMIILIFDPASMYNPGFQMSFAAVAALVVVYQDWNQIRRKRLANRHYEVASGLFPRALRLTGMYFGGLSATSLIAGIATALFALWHFHRVAPLGLITNLIAMPIVSMLVMPLSLLSMLLMPYGFEKLALDPLGLAINKVVEVADAVNAYEFDFETGARSTSFLIFSVIFLVLGSFLRTRLRLLCLIPLGLIFISGRGQPDLPDLLIAQDGRNIAMRSSLIGGKESAALNDGLTLLYPGRGKFITDIWRRAFIPNREFDSLAQSSLCSKDYCEIELSKKKLIIVYDPKLLSDACIKADILIAPRLWWSSCRERKPEVVINRTDLEKRGAVALSGIESEMRIATAWQAEQAGLPRRPWLNRFDNVSKRYPPRPDQQKTN
ncbi:MAG: ComEC/Rec2 family competence protein [Salaquimonas sp.]